MNFSVLHRINLGVSTINSNSSIFIQSDFSVADSDGTSSVLISVLHVIPCICVVVSCFVVSCFDCISINSINNC